jgi:hypothetical protein
LVKKNILFVNILLIQNFTLLIGGYQELREQLDKRGWVENNDYYSPCFDLKWTTQ